MSRFAANPKWLIYLPPTMSPCETSQEPGLLEHPAEAFAYYRHEGVTRVVCEEKHMGSRAVVVVCRDEDAARQRFGVVDEGIGICLHPHRPPLLRTTPRWRPTSSGACARRWTRAGLWDEFETDWICLDCELMPWSAKAQELLRSSTHRSADRAEALLARRSASC